MKGLIEKRNELVAELEKMVETAKAETRALDGGEAEKFSETEKQIEALDATIDAERRAAAAKLGRPGGARDADAETRAFAEFLLRGPDTRAAQSAQANANTIPAQFSQDVIRQVSELSGVFDAIRKVSSPGTYRQFTAGAAIRGGWAAELSAAKESAATFDFVEIGHHRYSVDVTISQEIESQSHFDIVSEVVRQIAEDFALACEQAVVNGTGVGQPLGLMSGGVHRPLKAENRIDADELISIQGSLAAPFSPGAKWLMSRETLLAVRQLADANGRYLFHEGDMQAGFRNHYVLGKPVAISEAMRPFEILYGNFQKAYLGNVRPEMSVRANPYIKADRRATVIHGDVWFDGRPVDRQAYVRAAAKK